MPDDDPWAQLAQGISLPAQVLQGLARQWKGHTLECGHLHTAVEFNYVRFDNNRAPMTKDLAKALAERLMHYALGEFEHPRLPTQTNRIQHEAREFLRNHPTSGEVGEVLLYAILEAFRGAPQVVSKLKLKTNTKEEVKGSDGVHIARGPDGIVDLYFGESKLYKSVSKAVKHAVASIEDFHKSSAEDHEIRLLQTHVRDYPEAVKKAIKAYCDRTDAAKTFRHNHAVLIGFEWDAYATLVNKAPQQIEQEFTKLYEGRLENLCKKVSEHVGGYKTKKLRFEFFFLPFTDVQAFRDAFYHAAGVPPVPATPDETAPEEET